MISFTAPAKINLSLNVVGIRDDGYHYLKSFIGFTKDGDEISIYQNDKPYDEITVTGEFAEFCPHDGSNHIIKAIKWFRRQYNTGFDYFLNISLQKNLPAGGGIGGGTSDAASTLLALQELWQIDVTQDSLAEESIILGADMPVCIHQKPTFVSGIGDEIKILEPPYHKHHLVLIYPHHPLATPAVFKQYDEMNQTFYAEITYKNQIHNPELYDAINCGNSLTDAAIALCPPIKDILSWLQANNNCSISAMSGSGSTVFAITKTRKQATDLQNQATAKGWFAMATELVF